MDTPSFSEFFTAIHGYDAFPWQVALADQVLKEGWLDISAPTGAGKTCAIEVWLYELAGRALSNQPIQYRRLVYIVDRRLVVDSTYLHAKDIAERLHQAREGPLFIIAKALRHLCREPVPLLVTHMRGGTWKDATWAQNPAHPVVITSTVDQAGSRLLGRGYGCSAAMQVVSAGLLGNDTLWLIDEAHLSQPAVDAFRRVATYHREAPERIANPPMVVEMTATPTNPDAAHGLTDADLDHPVLGKRLRASKPAALVKVNVGKGSTGDRLTTFATTVATHASKMKSDGCRVIGVILNRVAAARLAFDLLRQKGEEAILLTGRVRPHDRDELLSRWLPMIKAGREPERDEPLFVVATQCIEVGADIDFDALVTEAAPLDSLRQRFGRLNRLGRREQSSATILCRSDCVGKTGRDPVYGPATDATWSWLTADGRKSIDFGLSSLALPEKEQLRELVAVRPISRCLLREDVDNLAAINVPTEIDMGLYLHGVQSSADVYVVWRDDLTVLIREQEAEIVVTVAARPPNVLEQLPLPVWQFRNWLHGNAADVSDLEGQGIGALSTGEPAAQLILKYDSADPDVSQLVTADDIHPGDVIVLPANIGGCDRFGWAPDCTDPVSDLGDVAAWKSQHRPVMHIRQADSDSGDGELDIDAYLRQVSAPAVLLEPSRRVRTYPAGWLITAGRKQPYPGEIVSLVIPEEVSSDGCEVALHAHVRGVASWARQFGGLIAPSYANELEKAARLHDVGKADLRWQFAVAGGRFPTETLAKSAQTPDSFSQYLTARKQIGLPAKWRHDTLSIQLAELVENDTLVLHLIGAHHGWCHPWPSLVDDADPPTVAPLNVDGYSLPGLSGVDRTPAASIHLAGRCACRFDEVQRRFGVWQRCLLESLLILADWRQSARERTESAV